MEIKSQTLVKIHLADDDKNNRFLFDLAFKKLSHTLNLKTVPDEGRLLKYLSENSDTLPYILFLDLNMPRKNGSECLADIKQDKKFKQIPVIKYSTSLRDTIADILYQNGAHYYLQRCDYSALVICLKKIFDMLADNPNQPSRADFMLN